MPKPGMVYLVGSGPGDPDLLTVRALKLIQSADVVVYDRLVGQRILDLVPSGTMRVFVGKESGYHIMPQPEINELLLSLAKAGRMVVRLKGGDPYIFGRGAEEALELIRAGIAFKTVPGVSAASGIGAELGIPLTHRGLATSVRFVAGHLKEDSDLQLDWRSLADPSCTLVIYMGLTAAARISAELIQAGLPGSTPVALVENGTMPQERHHFTTLRDMPEAVTRLAFVPPTLILVGRVVNFAALLGREEWPVEIAAGSHG
ncbi:MAG: uroporphyrinogen-III C-methyltransferase [Rhodospirillales bacterium]|jgi:uroporphyrin-III C-methyltransferase/precorrin-2 dehydrogenase/sirohydrochlorin ferrochelatase/uroporphyrin-III C-methyltransferase|nr:uroporphyrinogen-III C-methyltransferase [Rhodospirillales bacterium]